MTSFRKRADIIEQFAESVNAPAGTVDFLGQDRVYCKVQVPARAADAAPIDLKHPLRIGRVLRVALAAQPIG
jgi:hypothetical protein